MKSLKRWAAIALAAAMAASLAACGGTSSTDTTAADTEAADTEAADTEAADTEAADTDAADDTEKVVRYGMGYDASTLDAGMATDDASEVPLFLLTEPLLRVQGNDVVPGIAESWDISDDACEWTFHLRESVFSDGTPVTAQTIADTIIRLVTPENALDNMSSLQDLAGAEDFMNGEGSVEDLGIEVVDDYTLKLTYRYPQYEKSFTTQYYAPVSMSLVESTGESYGAEAENFLGNGPFMLESWTHDSEIVMVKNPNYWDADSIKLDKIIQVAGATGDTAVDMISAGTLDAASFTSQMYLDSVMEISGMESVTNYNGTQSIHLNCEGKTDETGVWLSNVNFRKALSYAIDRNALVAAVYTTDSPASKVIPDSEMIGDVSLNDTYDYGEFNVTADTEKAQEYLAAAMEEIGVSDVSEIPTFTMLAFDSEGNIKCLNAVADMWSKNLGITCDLDMEPIMEMLNKALSRDFDFWKGGNGVTFDYADVLAGYDMTAGDGGAYSYNEDEEYHELYVAMISAPTWEERKKAEADLAAYWTDNMMDIEVTWTCSYYCYNSKITNLYVGSMFLDLTWADIEE